MTLLKQLLARLKTLWTTEPTVLLWLAAAVITFVAAKFGIVVDQHSLLEALEFDAPFLLAFVNRAKVVPLGKLRKPAMKATAPTTPEPKRAGGK